MALLIFKNKSFFSKYSQVRTCGIYFIYSKYSQVRTCGTFYIFIFSPVVLLIILAQVRTCLAFFLPQVRCLKKKVFSQNIHRSGPVAHFIYSSIFSHNSTGPDLSYFWYFWCLKIKVFKNIKIFTGPDLWHILYILAFFHIIPQVRTCRTFDIEKKKFFLKISQVMFKNSKYSQVRTCGTFYIF